MKDSLNYYKSRTDRPYYKNKSLNLLCSQAHVVLDICQRSGTKLEELPSKLEGNV
jgi:hypothetical protein